MHLAILDPFEHKELASWDKKIQLSDAEITSKGGDKVIRWSHEYNLSVPESWINHGLKDPQSTNHLQAQIVSLLWFGCVFSAFLYYRWCGIWAALLYLRLHHLRSSSHCVWAVSLHFTDKQCQCIHHLKRGMYQSRFDIQDISSARHTIWRASSKL